MLKILQHFVCFVLLASVTFCFAKHDHAALDLPAAFDFDLPAASPSHPETKHIEYWEQKGYCHHEYFDMTRQNMNHSQVDDWYPNQIEALARQYPKIFLTRGEVALFGLMGWNDFSFQCSIYLDGCTQVPTCEDVVKFVAANRRPDQSTANILNLSRKIWFAAKQIDSIARDYKFSYNMVELVENHVLTETKNLIQTFSIQPDSQADGVCSLIVASVNSAINLGTVALGTWGTIPGSITTMVNTGISVVQGAAAMAVREGGKSRGGTVAKEGKSDKPQGDNDNQPSDPLDDPIPQLDGVKDYVTNKIVDFLYNRATAWYRDYCKSLEETRANPPKKKWNPKEYHPDNPYYVADHIIEMIDNDPPKEPPRVPVNTEWEKIVEATKLRKAMELELSPVKDVKEVEDEPQPKDILDQWHDHLLEKDKAKGLGSTEGLAVASGVIFNEETGFWEGIYDAVSDTEGKATKRDASLSVTAIHELRGVEKRPHSADKIFVIRKSLDDVDVNILDASSAFKDRWDAMERAVVLAPASYPTANPAPPLSRRQQRPAPVNAAPFVAAGLRTALSMMHTGLSFHQSKRPTIGGEVGGLGFGKAQTAHGWCAAFGGGIPNQNGARASTMENYINDQKTNLRVAISQIFDKTVNGGFIMRPENTTSGVAKRSFFEDRLANGTTRPLNGTFKIPANVTVAKSLSRMMQGKTMTWPKHGGVPNLPAHDVEKTAIQNLRDFMITGILRNSHCYVKCSSYQNTDNALCKAGSDFACKNDSAKTLAALYDTCKKDLCSKSSFNGKAREACKNDACDKKKVMIMIKDAEEEYKKCKEDKTRPSRTPRNVLSGNRVCTDDGYACQTACWTSRSDLNREIPLLGKDRLFKYNLTLDDVRDKSIANYEERGNGEKGTPLNRFFKATMLGSEQPSNMALPVCKSAQLEMGDFDNEHTRRGGDLGINKRIPCTCGDWRSNETAVFMKAIGYAPHQALWSDTNARDTLSSLCPRNLRNLPPLNRYLAYCELHILHPQKYGTSGGTYQFDAGDLTYMHRVHLNHTDSSCESIKNDVANMQEEEANYWFCLRSPEAKRLFREERGHSWIPGAPVGKQLLDSHKKLCNKYVKNLKIVDLNVMDYPAALALKSKPWPFNEEELDEKDLRVEGEAEIKEDEDSQ